MGSILQFSFFFDLKIKLQIFISYKLQKQIKFYKFYIEKNTID